MYPQGPYVVQAEVSGPAFIALMMTAALMKERRATLPIETRRLDGDAVRHRGVEARHVE
jgi:hypothetical protein